MIPWLSRRDQTEHPQEHEDAWAKVKAAHGLLVPGGFGDRGVEGKILAAQYARTNKVRPAALTAALLFSDAQSYTTLLPSWLVGPVLGRVPGHAGGRH